MITTLCVSQKDQSITLVLGESAGMEEGAMMNVKADDFLMKKFQDFIQKHVNGHWVAYGISSSLSGVQEYFMLRSFWSSGPSIETWIQTLTQFLTIYRNSIT